MKNLKLNIYILGFILLSFLSSCSESMLETIPYSFTSTENFYKTAKDAELAINGCYSVLNDREINGNGEGDTFSEGLYFILNAGTDELIVNSENDKGSDQTQWALAANNNNNSVARFNWFFWYAGINRANLLLEKIDDIDMDDSRKLEIKAEARFLRGLYHMFLAKIFGGIPTYDVSNGDPLKARQPLSEVYELIIDDLKFAYENLNHRATILGRANKWTAGGYLAKVYCYLGSSKRFGVGSGLNFPLNSFDFVDEADMYRKALVVASDVVENSGYVLIDNYDYLFRETTGTYQREECLFMAEGSATSTPTKVHNWRNSLLPQGNRDVRGGGSGWLRPTGELYYKYSDGDFRKSHNLTRNIRLNGADVKMVDGIPYYEPNALGNPGQRNYSQAKFRYADPSFKNIAPGLTGGNFPLLRLADVMLLKAEAQFFTGDEGGARNTLSLVRSRVLEDGTTIEELNNAYYKTDFVEELLDERSRELAFECQRRFDLFRFNKFTEVINSLTDDAGYYNEVSVQKLKANWKEERIWVPIPSDQTSLNPNLLPNNPGF